MIDMYPGKLRAVLIALLALALAGCLSSRRPLFGDATAVALLGDGGRYQTYEATDSGGFKREERMSARRAGKSYEISNDRGDKFTVSFHPLPEGRFVAQSFENDEYSYGIVRMTDGVVFFYNADCDRQDKAKMTAFGVVVRDGGCKLDDVKDPQALFAAVDPGKLTSKVEPIGGRRQRR